MKSRKKSVKPIGLKDITIVDDAKMRKAITAAALGNAMEWFDFGVYGFVAYALGKVFFPNADPSVQMIAALATFSVPFLIRPLGGLFFGALGDKFGRQKILAATIVIMSLSTFAIGLIFSGLLILAVLLNFFIGVMASTLPAMFPTHIRYSALASAFNISVLIAGLTPTLAAWLVESTGNLYMPAYYLMVIAAVGLVTGLTMKETANKPLRGAAPAASDIEEARELLQEHHDNIEQKIEDIDTQIAELETKRKLLVQQHPRIE